MFSRLSHSTYHLRSKVGVSNPSTICLIGFSKSKALPFAEFFLSHRHTKAIAFGLWAPFWWCVITSFFIERGNKKFFVWSNIHSRGLTNMLANKLCKLLSYEVYCLEDGIFKGNIIHATTSFTYTITKDHCYFNECYWQSKYKIDQTIFNTSDFRSYKKFYKLQEFSGTKYAEPFNIENTVSTNKQKIVIIGQVDGDRALRQRVYKDVNTNIKFIKWALTHKDYKDAKIVFRPHPYDNDVSTIAYCEQLNIDICTKNLGQYVDEIFVARTSMLSLDLSAKGHDVRYYSNTVWAKELMESCDAGNDSTCVKALKAKYYLLSQHHLFANMITDFDAEGNETNQQIFIYCLNRLIEQLGSQPEAIIDMASLRAEIKDNFDLKLSYFASVVTVTFGTWEYFLISHALTRLGMRNYSKYCALSATSLLDRASTLNALELAHQIIQISHLFTDSSSAREFTTSLWNKLKSTSDDELLLLNYSDAINLIFRFGAYQCLSGLIPILERWMVLVKSATFSKYDTRLNGSFFTFCERLDNYSFVKSFFADLPESRVGLTGHLSTIRNNFKRMFTGGSFRHSIRRDILTYLSDGEITLRESVLPLIPNSIDFLLLKLLLLNVTRNPDKQNVIFAKHICTSYLGAIFINWYFVEQLLWSKHRPVIEDFSAKMFRLKFLAKIINPAKLAVGRNRSSTNDFKHCYQTYIQKMQKIQGKPKELIVLFFGGCLNSQAMFLELLPSLTKMGVAVVDPFENFGHFCVNFELAQLPNVEQIATQRSLPKDLCNAWDIAWNKKHVIQNGVNYYQGFYERISTYYRRYQINLNTPEESALFQYELARADKVLTILDSMLKLQSTSGLKITSFLSNSHVSPYFVVKQKLSELEVPFYLIGATYSRFLEPKFTNSTAHFKISKFLNRYSKRAPFLISETELEAWKIRNSDKLDEYRSQTKNILRSRFSNLILSDKKTLLVFEKWRKKHPTGKVIMCLGKVSVDLGHQYDGGHIFSDYKEYIFGLRDFALNHENVFVFFRPHPHEINPEVSLALVDKMSDWIGDCAAGNISLASPSEISMGKMIELVDVTTVYNGSPILEFNALGLSIIPFSHQAEIDYPVGQPQLKTLLEIVERDFPVTEKEKQKAIDLISCSFFDDTAFYSRLTRFSSHNLSVNVPAFVSNNFPNNKNGATLPTEL